MSAASQGDNQEESSSGADLVTEAEGLRIELDGAVLRLTMCRPDVRNAQTPKFWERLREARDIASAGGVQVVVLSGEGTSFSAGLDTRMLTPEGVPGQQSLLELAMQEPDDVHRIIGEIQESFAWLSDGPAITIAAVQGHAVGAGFQLALACDLIVCAEDARFSMKEATYGLIPDLTGTSPLVRTVGYQRSLEICLTTRWVLADEAVTLGLAVDSVPGDALADRVAELVQVTTGGVPGTGQEMKALLRNAVVATPAEQRVAERDSQIRRFAALRKIMAG